MLALFQVKNTALASLKLHCFSICDFAHETPESVDLQCYECVYTQIWTIFQRLKLGPCPVLQIFDSYTLLP